jgi:hypothetical protein
MGRAPERPSRQGEWRVPSTPRCLEGWARRRLDCCCHTSFQSSISPQHVNNQHVTTEGSQQRNPRSTAVSNISRRSPIGTEQSPAYRPTRPSPTSDLQFQGQRAASVRTESAQRPRTDPLWLKSGHPNWARDGCRCRASQPLWRGQSGLDGRDRGRRGTGRTHVGRSRRSAVRGGHPCHSTEAGRAARPPPHLPRHRASRWPLRRRPAGRSGRADAPALPGS